MKRWAVPHVWHTALVVHMRAPLANTGGAILHSINIRPLVYLSGVKLASVFGMISITAAPSSQIASVIS